MAGKVENWVCDKLGKLGIDASEEVARYILSIETAEDLEEYMRELLDADNKKTDVFIKELLVKWRPYHTAHSEQNVQVYKKTAVEDSYVAGKERKPPKEQRNKAQKQTFNINGYDVENRGILPGEERPRQELPAPVKSSQSSSDSEVKKKQKFVPLYSKEGMAMSVVQLPGRHACECQAAKHKLINNCRRCGRVVCEQEGSGPCLYCGNLVYSREEEEMLNRGTKKSEKLRQQLMRQAPATLLGSHLFNLDREYFHSNKVKMADGLSQAERHKEKLLDYDKTSVRRTQVIDDESDYFSTDSNQWLSSKDREMLKKREEELRSKRFASRKDRKITLDFAGRQVIEEDPASSVNMYDVNDDIVQQVNFGARPKVKQGDQTTNNHAEQAYLLNPNIEVTPPKFVPQNTTQHAVPSGQAASRPGAGAAPTLSRIQDRELQEMSDEGCCMSMHQPWASLLVAGIKIHEGRTWYSSHRGRLWIAATAKTPEPAEIANMEQAYRLLYKGRDLSFPSHYPVGCLLGCVEVTDCLAQDTYHEQYPEGESASPYVFICDNPKELLVKFPIKGKHKIYKLEGHIHKAAKKGLR